MADNTNNKELMQVDKMELAIYNVINNLPSTLDENERLCASALKLHEATLLAGALALLNIAEKGMFLELGFKTLDAYLRERGDKLGIGARSRSTVYEYFNMAEAYKNHADALYKAGFQESKDSSKLKFFHIAVETHNKNLAIKNLPKMSYREYVSWARGNDLKIAEDAEAEEEIEELFDITDRGFVRDGKVIVSKKKVEKIIEDGEMPFVIGIQNAVEARLLGRRLKQIREEARER